MTGIDLQKLEKLVNSELSSKILRSKIENNELLFETNSLKLYDYTVVVTAPKFLQDKRVLKRPGMTKEKYENINSSQMPDFKKKNKADFIVHSGLGIAYAFNKVKFIVNKLRNIR